MGVWLVDIFRNANNLSWSERLEVPRDEDIDYKVDQWCNRDLYPLTDPNRRTYDVLSYCGYWTVSGSCVSAYVIGSTMLELGLNAKQAIACVVVGSLLTGLLAVSCGWIGEIYHIGFTVASRYSYGFYGSYVPVIIRSFIACMWFGMQAYWGGQATRNLIGAVIPGFIDGSLNDLFSETSHLAKNDFIALCIWGCFFCYFLTIPPERMQVPFCVSFFFFAGTCFGLLIWAVHVAGGAGPLFHSRATAPSVGWGIAYGITALVGSWGAGCLGTSDWSRYAKRRYAPTLSQMVVAPATIIVTALIGIIVTSASSVVFGELIWNPINLIPAIQHHYHSSPGARAGCFFASIGVVSAQMTISVVLNSVSTGMDLSGLCPKYINIRRGSYLMAAIGICCQPWTLVSSATKFLTVLSGFGIFISPMTGVMLADFFVVRRMKLRLCDLYRTHDSIYWYGKEGDWKGGFQWKGFFSVAFATAFLMPGLIAAAGPYPIAAGWSRLYNLTFIVGTAMSFTIFSVLSYFFPPPGLGEVAPFLEEDVVQNDSVSEPENKVNYSVEVSSV